MRHIHAFSLIELMVVIAIVGVLSTVALPSYKSYMIRAKVVSLMPLADTLKIDISMQHITGVVYGTTNNVTLIATGASNKPRNLNQLLITNYGCIQIDYDLAQLGLANGGSDALRLAICPSKTNGNITWNCGYDTGTTVAYATAYLPSNCTAAVTKDTSF